MSGVPPVVHSKDEWAQFAASRQRNERHKITDSSADYWAPVELPGKSGRPHQNLHWPDGLQGISVKTAEVFPQSADGDLTIRTKVSTSIQYAEVGPIDATTAVLLIHGFGESWRVWQSTMLAQTELGLTKRMIAVDLRGFGKSSPSQRLSSSHSIGHHVDDMVGLMDGDSIGVAKLSDGSCTALGLSRVSVVSHSVGSVVALRMAVEHPERVASLLLVSGAASYKGNEVVHAWWQGLLQLSESQDGCECCVVCESVAEEGSAARDDSEPATMHFVGQYLGSRFSDPAAVPTHSLECLQKALRLPHRAVLRANMQSILEEDLTEELCAVSVPVTVLRGSDDCVVSEKEQADMVVALPHGTLRVLPGAAHMIPVEQPRTLARILQTYAYTNEEHFAIGSDAIVGEHLQTQLRLANMSNDCLLANEDYCHPRFDANGSMLV